MSGARTPGLHVLPFAALFLGLTVLLVSLSRIGLPPWGDGLEFAAVSSHLGVAHPPGYPIYTLAGWVLSKLTRDAYLGLLLLNAAAACAAASAGYLFVRDLLRMRGWEPAIARGGALLLAFVLAFSAPVASALLVAEVYLLHAALLLSTAYLLFRAEHSGARERGVLLLGGAVLLGIAIAHQLPALSLLPLFILVTVRPFIQKATPREAPVLTLTAWLIVAMLPVLLYGSLMLRSGAPGIYWGDVRTVEGLMDHVRGGEYRQFRLLHERPGVPFSLGTWAPFAAGRLLDLFRHGGSLVFGLGPTALVAGVASLALAGFGFWKAWSGGAGRIFLLGLLAAAGAQAAFVLVYNIADISDYYLPVLVLLAPFAGVGLLACLRQLEGRFSGRYQGRLLPGVPAILLLLCLFRFSMEVGDHRAQRLMAGNWAERAFSELPEGAALLTAGDADIYTAWHLQFARGERTDVFVFGSNFIRFPWFRQSLPPDDPRTESVTFHPGSPGTMEEFLRQLADGVIDPLLEHGPVYTTIANPAELHWLGFRYRLNEVRPLLTRSDIAAIEALGLINAAPPVLYELRPNNNRGTPL